MFNIFYKKNDNKQLFKNFKEMGIDNIQNYIPIYKKFFNLQENNYHIINLNQNFNICNVKESNEKNIYKCLLNSDKKQIKTTTFFKFSPLIDPVKYIVGKYDRAKDMKSVLPKLSNNICLKKVLDDNNSAYVDGFFSYLTSNLLHHHKYIHGLDFYGSFLGVKKNFKINVFDDLEYLNDSEYFHKNKDVLFTMDDINSDIFFDGDTRNYKTKLKIDKNISNKSIYSLNNEDFDNLFVEEQSNLKSIKLPKQLVFEYDLSKNSMKSKSSSECSSRLSYTSNEEYSDDEELDEIIDEINKDNESYESSSDTDSSINSDI